MTPDVLALKVEREWRYYCNPCADSGTVSKWCAPKGETSPKPWYQPASCGRENEHYAHEWATACPCAESNPAIKRRKDAAQVRYAPEPSRRSA